MVKEEFSCSPFFLHINSVHVGSGVRRHIWVKWKMTTIPLALLDRGSWRLSILKHAHWDEITKIVFNPQTLIGQMKLLAPYRRGKSKHQADQPEIFLLKIKDFMDYLFRNLSWFTWKKYFFIQMNVCFKILLSNQL